MLVAVYALGVLTGILLLSLRRRRLREELRAIGDGALARVDDRLRQLELRAAGAGGALRAEIAALADETARLERALRVPNAAGQWGELQLRRAVELAGLVAHVDFVEQQSFDDADGDGGRLRPDLIVRLPGGRAIVVDAKAPLQAWAAALDAGDEATHAARLREHARHVREHARALAGRGYQRLAGSPDLVVMFLPAEGALAAALAADPSLIELGAGRVLLAGPLTLLATLRAVALGWREARAAAETREAAALARLLCERLAGMAAHLGGLRKGLTAAVDGFDRVTGTLDARVWPAARRLAAIAGTDEPPAPRAIERAPREP